MKVTGIIAEYNPFHNGHEYQMKTVRQTLNPDFLIVVLSGDHVQRGTPALLDKFSRTQMALCCGADLVLELPVSYACSSAEYFAEGAVSLLHGLGVVTHLCFGCETPRQELFIKTASLLNQEPPSYRQALKASLKKGLPYPAARAGALTACLHPNQADSEEAALLRSPNNLLGVEYCRVLNKLHSPIKPWPILRVGSGYHEQSFSDPDSYPSASAIRSYLSAHSDLKGLYSQMPRTAARLLQKAVEERRNILEDDYSLLLQTQLLRESLLSLTEYLDLSEELSRRIIRNRNQFQSFSQFCRLLKTKEVTYTRIQRSLLHVLLNLKEIYPVSYARVLGFRKESAELLHRIKKEGSLPLLTKLANAREILSPSGQKLLAQDVFASNFYQAVSSQKSGLPFIHEYQKPIIIQE